MDGLRGTQEELPGIDLCIGEIIIVICGEFLCKTRGTYRSLICSIINGGDFVDGKNLKGGVKGIYRNIL